MNFTGSMLAEIQATTRRGFVEMLYDQISNQTPFFNTLFKEAQVAYGGESQINVPVYGANTTVGSWGGSSGVFQQPQVLNGTQDISFNLNEAVVPVAVLDSIVRQQDRHAIINKLDTDCWNSGQVMKELISSAIFSGATANQVTGLFAMVDDGTNYPIYGGIDGTATGNGFWKATCVFNASLTTTTANLITQYITQCQTNALGEKPTIGLAGPGLFTELTNTMTSLQRYNYTPNDGSFSTLNTGFNAIMVNNTPIYLCPEMAPAETTNSYGTLLLLNMNYINLYIHRLANFYWYDFQSLIPVGQMAHVGLLVTDLELVCSKRRANMQVTNLSIATV